MSDRLVTERELEGLLRRLQGIETQLGRRLPEVPIYTQGTWTPAWSGTSTNGAYTYSATTNGQYTRTGRKVDISGRIQITAIITPPTGNMQIRGLPSTLTSSGTLTGGIYAAYLSHFNYSATAKELTFLINTSTTFIDLYESFDAAVAIAVPAANFTDAACDIFFVGAYFLD